MCRILRATPWSRKGVSAGRPLPGLLRPGSGRLSRHLLHRDLLQEGGLVLLVVLHPRLLRRRLFRVERRILDEREKLHEVDLMVVGLSDRHHLARIELAVLLLLTAAIGPEGVMGIPTLLDSERTMVFDAMTQIPGHSFAMDADMFVVRGMHPGKRGKLRIVA